MKDLFIITYYFPPEIGAASNRIYHLAKGLSSEYTVTVVTPLPNYPTGEIFKEYKGKFTQTNFFEEVKVVRLWLYASNSKQKIKRLFAMISYSLSLIWYFLWHKAPSTVIIQSPPLLVAFTSLLFLKSKKRKLILNVSDLWPRAGLELGALKKGYTYQFLKKIERYNYKQANVVLGQSQEILDHVVAITRQPQLFLYRNYPDFKPSSLPIDSKIRDNKLKIVYAGLLGVAQGILKLCESLNYESIELHIYGSGAEELQIKKFIEDHKNLPVFFHGKLDRTELHKKILDYDVAIIPLLKRIYGSVPSKIFEFAKLGMPLLYFGGGEGENIVNKYQLGWIASAGDYTHLNEIIKSIDPAKINDTLRDQILKTAQKEFDFNTQLKGLKKAIQ